ncbi:MAG: LuxR C-terminal-related transcriptional regulator [Nitratireductor sp.]|uniref:helix-turn-helix domain-containing protein n=1 Tax=Alphaproteobacteria TaxID=28211 RepID=UPI00326AFAC0
MNILAARNYILDTARLIVPATRVLFYEVDGRFQPYGHISSTNENWGGLYRKFVTLDPYHPRCFAKMNRNVFGTAPGYGPDLENADYVEGFRKVLGIRHKAEMFLRDAEGGIRAGLRYARLEGEREFTTEEMIKLSRMQPLFANLWCTALVHNMEAQIFSGLTEREREVFDLLLSGYPNQDISRLLSIALPTVKNHVKAILAKTGYANRAELLAALYRAGHVLRAPH